MGVRGVSWNKLGAGSELEQAGSWEQAGVSWSELGAGSKLEQAGSELEQAGVRWEQGEPASACCHVAP